MKPKQEPAHAGACEGQRSPNSCPPQDKAGESHWVHRHSHTHKFCVCLNFCWRMRATHLQSKYVPCLKIDMYFTPAHMSRAPLLAGPVSLLVDNCAEAGHMEGISRSGGLHLEEWLCQLSPLSRTALDSGLVPLLSRTAVSSRRGHLPLSLPQCSTAPDQ